MNIAIIGEYAQSKLLEDCIEKYMTKKGSEYCVEQHNQTEAFLEMYDSIKLKSVFINITLSQINDAFVSTILSKNNDFSFLIFVIKNVSSVAVRDDESLLQKFKSSLHDEMTAKLDKALTKTKRQEINKISISTQGCKKIYDLKELMYVEVDRHNISYHFKDREIKCYGVLSNIAKELESANFARSSSRYLVNLSFVTSIVETQEVMLGDIALPLSRLMKKNFMESLTNYLGYNI